MVTAGALNGEDTANSQVRKLPRITYKRTKAAVKVDKVDLTDLTPYIPAPVTGATGIGYFNAPQYGGTVAWKAGDNPHSGPFAAGTDYTATVSLTPAAGYTFTGVDSFTYTGASSVLYTSGSSVVTINFPTLDKILISGPIDLTLYLPAPAAGAQPVTALAVPVGSPFTGGTVTWMWKEPGKSGVHSGAFAANTAYTATVSLSPAAGYTFDGLAADSFIHSQSDGTPVFAVDGANRTVTINFVKTPVTLIQNVLLNNYIPNPVVGERKMTHFVGIGYSGDITWQGGVLGDFFVSGVEYKADIILSPLPGYAFDPDCFKDDIEKVIKKDENTTPVVAGYVQASAGLLKKIGVTVLFLPDRLVVTFYFNSLPPPPSPPLPPSP
jgi:hypothetical protein